MRLLALPLIFLSCLCINGSAQSSLPINKQKIDQRARKAPKKWHQDLPKLTAYLTEGATNDFEKARSIYSWIVSHISYDHKVIEDNSKRINKNIRDILTRRKAICMGYAQLFEAMAKLAELEAATVDGYSKGTTTSKADLDEPDHSWNAVKLAGDWYLLDATWGSSLALNDQAYTTINEDFFLTAPAQFLKTHLPIVPFWQLLPCPISPKTYEEGEIAINKQVNSCDSSYHYQDSLQQYLQLPTSDRRLRLATLAYTYNPTEGMRQEYGHALMDYAGTLSDSVDIFQQQDQLEPMIRLQKEIISTCEHADSLIEFHTWQNELFAETIINHVVALFQQNQGQSTPITPWPNLISKLEQAQLILQDIKKSYFKDMALQQCEQYISILKDYAR
ncbi:MAG: hypothetical protein KTR30_36280 [Saprospiraceae bacterium]|nr:hypothetical protein [Saprospiraceae bacterium]